MKSTRESYLELLAELQLHLLQEMPRKSWIQASFDNFTYFKAQAASAPLSRPINPTPAPATQNSPPSFTPRKTIPPKPAPLPAPPPVEAKAEAQPNIPFTKEPIGKAPAQDLSEMRKLVAEKHPKWEYVEPPPFKEKGAPVVVFAGKGESLLHQIGQAIHNQLAPAETLDLADLMVQGGLPKILERRGLRLLIMDEMALRTYPDLLKHYRPTLGVIGSAPAIVLTDTAGLANDPQRKRAIWNSIKERLA